VQCKGGLHCSTQTEGPHLRDDTVCCPSLALRRRWLDAAGPVPYKDGQALGPILPRQRVLEHYESHVLKCPDCQKGLTKLRQKQTAALIGSEYCVPSKRSICVDTVLASSQLRA
jgi:hypothetical protein